MQGKKESKSNRLIHEKSPYLLQHAHNPVDWYPWGEEAFEKATREDKPIFLSIGYSTCHWCHTMRRESFEDEEVAKILHDHFVAIKVDREERPDLDHIYMTFCQAITGQGGWPLTVFLTPDQKPFYAGTYFPKQDMGSRIGLVTLLNKIKELWQTKRDELLSTSSENTKSIQDHIDNVDHQDIEKYVVEETLGYFKENFDEIYGGFGFAPKFPTPHNLRFLLRCWKENKEEEVLNMVEKTLQSMYAGGIYDHIGYGFSRYSTDGEWLVPHFEKMLYDNALLAITYLETYQVTSNPLYAQVAEEIFTYILRDMSHPDGGFYSAEDADSEGVEGKFYVWSKKEITNILGEKEGEEFCKLFDITTYGNFEGKNIPNLIDYGLSHPKDQGKIQQWKEKLFEYREKRIHPHKDDKILTSWNGMMIAALAMGGKVLKKDEYISAAEKSIHFILKNLRDERGRLYARFREGERAYLGYLDDYAYIVWALTELYDATYNFDYIQLAKEINGQMIELFWDEEKGGLFFNGKDAESLLFRPKDIFDGAMPSGNSVATLNFLKLARIFGDAELENYVEKQFAFFGESVNSVPMSHTHLLMAYMFSRGNTSEVVIVGKKDNREIKQMIDILHRKFLPRITTVVGYEGENKKLIDSTIEFVAQQKMIDGKSTAYICQNFSCQQPITDVEEFKENIMRI